MISGVFYGRGIVCRDLDDDAAMMHFAEANDYSDRTERLITGLAWEVPAIELRGDQQLVAGWDPLRRAVVPRGGLLHRFCGLKAAPAARIAAFASRFGLLYLCEKHGLPRGHEPDCDGRILPGSQGYYDDVAEWRKWARRLEATAELSRAIQSRRSLTPSVVEDTFCELTDFWDDIADRFRRPNWMDLPAWGTLADGRSGPLPPPQWEAPPFGVQIFYLIRWINALLATARVGRQVVRPGREDSLAIVDGFCPACPLFGALVLELAAECARVQTLGRCRACGRGFKPKSLATRYCKQCRDPRVRWRIAQADRRQRLRGRGLSSRGRNLKGSAM